MSLAGPLIRPAAQAARLDSARPAWKAGLRTGVATVLPVVVGEALGFGGTSWMMLGAFNAAIADKGGAYRTRAAVMAGAALGGGVTVTLGSLAGHSHALSIALAFAVTAALAMLRVYGAGATSVGLLSTTVFLIALASPAATAGEAAARGAAVLAGSCIAMLLSLVLWPLRVYRPARAAVAGVLHDTANFVAGVAAAAQGTEPSAWRGLAAAHHPRLRASLETARATLAAIRRGRQGETGRGERLLVMLEAADRLFPALVALAFVLEGVARRGRVPDAAIEGLREVEAVLRRTAAAAESERRAEVRRPEGWNEPAWRALLERMTAETAGEADDAAELAHAAQLLDRLHEYVEVAAQTAEALGDGAGAPALARTEADEPVPERTGMLAPLRAAFAPDSVVLRHALRVGVAAGMAAALTSALGLKRGYWVTLTVVIVLQPYTGATLVKALQRVLGTVLGGLIAAGIAAAIHDPRGIMAAIFVTAVLGVAMQPLNYGAYSVFLTPTFVLMAEVGAGDWHLVGVRVLNTLLGGAIALAGAFVLWPSPERQRLPALAAHALRRSGAYLDRALGALTGEDSGGLAGARRDAGLAATNAEASFQRLLSESGRRDEELEPWMALMTYTRRLTAAAATLATARRLGPLAAPDAVAAFRADAARAVTELAAAVEAERPPAPLPDLRAEAAAAPLLRAHLERASRQLAVLHSAATRLHPPSSVGDAEAPPIGAEEAAEVHTGQFRP
jgi:uncharacterized membrane protein YccC